MNRHGRIETPMPIMLQYGMLNGIWAPSVMSNEELINFILLKISKDVNRTSWHGRIRDRGATDLAMDYSATFLDDLTNFVYMNL